MRTTNNVCGLATTLRPLPTSREVVNRLAVVRLVTGNGDTATRGNLRTLCHGAVLALPNLYPADPADADWPVGIQIAIAAFGLALLLVGWWSQRDRDRGNR